MSATATALVGIAKSAAESQLLIQKQNVQYRDLATRRWINRCDSARVPFDWTINPYRGCEIGCKYCYARYTHEFMGRWDSDSFETQIYSKIWDRNRFAAELRTVKRGQAIAIGTATDPYQPAERKFELTRRVLEVLAESSDRRIYLTTKSDLVVRDIDLLQEIASKNSLSVAVTVTTTDRVLARLLEPYAPRPDLRVAAVKSLASAGVPVGVFASPVVPMITDSAESLEAVARAAKDAGAVSFGAGVLFLKESARRVFFPFLEEQFPHLLARYKASYAQTGFLQDSYSTRISAMVDEIRQRLGLFSRPLAVMSEPGDDDGQLRLF
jgi:DNA repair photolyase